MKKFQKFVTVALALVLIVQAVGLTASAESDPASVTVSLSGSAVGAVEGSVYEVGLSVSELNVGGAQGTVSYDPAKFDFENVSMKQSVATVNQLTADESDVLTAGDLIKVDETAGTVKFAMLSDKTNNEWVKLRFTVKEVAEAVSTASFTLSDVKVSNTAGTAAIPATTADLTPVSVVDAALTMEGSTVRTDGTYDLRYEISLSPTFMALDKIKQVGVILVPTALVKEGAELLNDPTGESFCVKNSSGTQVKPNISVMDYVSDNTNTIYANITKTGTSHMNRAYSLRAFVVLEDGTTVYADNVDTDKAIDNGTASRSCKSTMVAIYNKNITTELTDAIGSIIEKDTWTAEDYQTVCAALADKL